MTLPAATAPDNAPAAGERALLVGLWLVVALPAWAVLVGRASSGSYFVLYREPKLAAIQILGWSFLAVLLWRRGPALAEEATRELRARPALLLLAALLVWMVLSSLWVRVRENLVYELGQHLLLFALLLCLLAWGRHQSGVAAMARTALVAAAGVATLIGLWQAWRPIAWLPPIDPQMGVVNPSLMGYKNPMALAILGQVFLLADLALARRRRAWRLALGLLLAAELAYLAHLQSRTSWVALLAGLATLAALGLLSGRWRSRARQLALLTLGTAALFATVLALHPASRARAATLLPFLADPAAFAGSDRGTYARNTFEMVRHNPLGVGLGDWQTHYPVYRRHGREVAFSDAYQVRRAHSDHVQMLGELGWPGLALWLAFLAALLGAAVAALRRSGRSLFVAAQIVAVAAAMATDYFLEMPYHKLLLYLLAFEALSLAPGRPSPAARRPYPAAARVAVGLLVGGVAALQVFYATGLARKSLLAAEATQSYLRAVASLEEGREGSLLGEEHRRHLERSLAAGARLDRLPGHTKTLHRDYLVLAHTAALLGQGDAALACTRRSLELHPYSPNAMALAARLCESRGDCSAELWRRARHHVLHEATRGFEGVYPSLPGRVPEAAEKSR